jgi:hypothetical protein
MRCDICAQLRNGNEPRVKSKVSSHDRFSQWISTCKVDNSPERRSCRKAAAKHDLVAAQRCPPHYRTRAARNAESFWNRDFDRIAWCYIQSLKPGRRASRKSRTGGQTPRDTTQLLQRVLHSMRMPGRVSGSNAGCKAGKCAKKQAPAGENGPNLHTCRKPRN